MSQKLTEIHLIKSLEELTLQDEKEEKSNEIKGEENNVSTIKETTHLVEVAKKGDDGQVEEVLRETLEKEGQSESNLIVKCLPQTVTEEELTELFSAHGEIESCKLICDRSSNLSLGYGFVKFVHDEDAAEAVASLNSNVLGKRVIKVMVAKPSTKEQAKSNLYIAGLPREWTRVELESLFSQYGRIVQSRVLVDRYGHSRGIGFVRFENIANAEKAIAEINNNSPPGGTEPLIVKFARDKSSRNLATTKEKRPTTSKASTMISGERASSARTGGKVGKVAVQTGNSISQVQAQAAAAAARAAGGNPLNINNGVAFQMIPNGYSIVNYQGYPVSYSMYPYNFNSFNNGFYSFESFSHFQQISNRSGDVVGQNGLFVPRQAQSARSEEAPESLSGPVNLEGRTACLFVFHLPPDIQNDDLFNLFSLCGTVLSVKVITDPVNQQSKGYGFVNMASLAEAQHAIQTLNGMRMGRKYLKVSFKKNKTSHTAKKSEPN